MSQETPTRARSYHRQTCRLCDSPDTQLVVEIEPIPLAEKYVTAEHLDEPADVYPVDLYQCLGCGHVQLLDVIDPDVLWKDYTYHSGQTRGIVEHFEGVAEGLLARYAPPPGSLVVDIGSNDGSLLRPFQQKGMRVVGVDPAVEIARAATEAGIPTIPRLMSPEVAREIRREHGAASIVTAFNVFAHTDDMHEMCESVRELLAADGIFVFEAQYLLDIIDRTLLGTIFHEHICHHSVKPLIGFFERHGMELLDVERVTIQNGSIIGTVQLRGGGHPVQPSVAAMLALEEERGLDRPEAVRVLAERLAKLRRDAGALVADWKQRGCTVAGYGAARSGPTLINQLGLADVLGYVLDDHPQKVHKYTPGHHIPVVPTSELLERMPDYAVILAWIHAKKIIANNQEYLRRGGRFVVCCPEVRVVGPGESL